MEKESINKNNRADYIIQDYKTVLLPNYVLSNRIVIPEASSPSERSFF